MLKLFLIFYERLAEAWQQKRDRRKLAKMRAKRIKDLADKIQRSRKIKIVKSHNEIEN